MKKISKILSKIPTYPGVYFFKDNNGKILYIGKAKNLKKRVSSYFNKSNKSSKNKLMVSKAKDIETMVTANEVEALIAESNMIKIHKPKYNISLKDDKTFPYIIITDEPYPKVEIIRKKKLRKDGNTYFGPYTDVGYLRLILKTLHQIFPLRTCSFFIDSNTIKTNKIKVCLDYHIDKCQGPCEGLISINDYNLMIDKVIDFLKGRNSDVKKYLFDMMNNASRHFKYEEAARYRDQIEALDAFQNRQTKIAQKFSDRDIISISYKNSYAIALVMRVRNGVLVGREKFELQIGPEFDLNIEFEKFIVQYYRMTMDFPKEIIADAEVSDLTVFSDWINDISDKKIRIFKPYKGEKRKILDNCIKNNELLLKEYLIKKIKRKEYIPKTLSQLKEDLNMPIVPKRIEAFDNSNIQGAYPVAGMVVFIDGKPVKSKYRKYNINTVKGVDDFESMREVVYRRYMRQLEENRQLPDLILIDGGKGQLSAAKSSLDKLGLGYISIIGLAKKFEEVFIPDLSDPQSISKTSSSIYLLRKIRDEVHRFSVKFHRSKRKKGMKDSILGSINGLGEKRIKLLWDNYDSLDEVLNDSSENINKKTNIPLSLVNDIKKTIEKNKKDSNE